MPTCTITPSRAMQILLVEDDVDTALAMRRLLERSGHVVTVADSVSSALRSARKSSIDLLICDVRLPDGNGFDLMRELKQHASLAGICMSGHGSEDDIRQSQAAGFAAHLTKPFDLPALESLIERVAGKLLSHSGLGL